MKQIKICLNGRACAGKDKEPYATIEVKTEEDYNELVEWLN